MLDRVDAIVPVTVCAGKNVFRRARRGQSECHLTVPNKPLALADELVPGTCQAK
jgi:hypothetical protein